MHFSEFVRSLVAGKKNEFRRSLSTTSRLHNVALLEERPAAVRRRDRDRDREPPRRPPQLSMQGIPTLVV